MIKRLHHTCVTVKDLDKSIAFYRDTLGLELIFTHEIGDHFGRMWGVGVERAKMKLAQLKAGDCTVELIQYVTPKGRPFDRLRCDVGDMHIAFQVSDIYQTYNMLKNKGVKFHSPPNEITEGPEKGNIWCYFDDPDGVHLELVQVP